MQQGNTTPAWSGVFWEQEDGTGYMSVAWADIRTKPYPVGWEIVDVEETDEAVTYIFRKAS